MTRVTPIRVVLVVVGLGFVGVGVQALLQQPVAKVLGALLWLGGGVVVHDGIFAPAVVVAGIAAVTLLPWWARGPVAAGAVVIGTLTLAAVPALGRFGAMPGDPTVLDRPYLTGWLVVAGIVAVGIGVAALEVRRRGGG
jgi:hypothetical protein